MTATAPAAVAAPPRRRRRLRWTLLLGLPLLALAVPLGVWQYNHWSDERAVAEAIAETERLDPRWRFDDVLADRPPIADAENASLQVMRVMQVHGAASFAIPNAEYDAVQQGAPTVPLTAAQRAALRELLDKSPKPLAEARKLRTMPRGRPQIKYSPDFISTLATPLQHARDVGVFLHCDVLVRADEGDFEAALQSCRAMLNAARSIGDEPILIGVLVRVACVHMTIDALERVLAQGVAGAAELAEMQTALEQELAEPTLLIGLRGERGGQFQMRQMMCDGKLRPSHVAAITGKRVTTWQRFTQDMLPSQAGIDRAGFLRQMNELIEAAQLPIEQQQAAFDRVRTAQKAAGDRNLFPFLDAVIRAYLRLQANLRCAIAAIAAERYRLVYDAWPMSLEAVVKEGTLAKMPRDPYDGQPLRYKAAGGGVLIYSIGPDRIDNGGAIERNGEPRTGTDQGMRLWDAPARGKKAAG
jgi:hypothetical protein